MLRHFVLNNISKITNVFEFNHFHRHELNRKGFF